MDAQDLITRAIPSSGEELPAVGLGTWPVFDVGGEARVRVPLRRVLHDLADCAGNGLVDTSPMYGRAEAVTGELVAELAVRPRLFLATKVWTRGREAGIAQMRQSASLLKSPVIDLMQIHNLVDWRIQLETLRGMKERGDIRYLGITHYTPGSLAELIRIVEGERGIDFVQFGYSLASREAEARLLPVCAARGVATIANQPLQQGELLRRARGREVPPWAAEFGCTGWAQLCLKYLLGEPALTCAIPATGNPAHLADNLAAGRGRLPDSGERARIRRLWDSL